MGHNLIVIDGYKFSRIGHHTKRKCKHRSFVLDAKYQTVHCEDCNVQVSSYFVLESILDVYQNNLKDAQESRERAIAIEDEANKKYRWLEPLKELQRAWRGKNKMAVCCPHCDAGILPGDGLGSAAISEEWEMARRKKVKQETQNK